MHGSTLDKDCFYAQINEYNIINEDKKSFPPSRGGNDTVGAEAKADAKTVQSSSKARNKA